MSISAEAWNKALEKIRRCRPLVARGAPRKHWRHPWEISAKWMPEREAWAFEIEPGFVVANMPGRVTGVDVSVRLDRDFAPKAALERVGEEVKSVDCFLSEAPQIPLVDLRAIGSDAVPFTTTDGTGNVVTYSEPVPDFFRFLGVSDPRKSITEEVKVQHHGELDAPPTGALLRAADVVLYMDRPAARMEWMTGPGIDGLPSISGRQVYTIPNGRSGAYVRTMAEFKPPIPASLRERLGGLVDDVTFDYTRIATIYLLSPPGVAPGTEIDGTWTAYVKHDLFWNVCYALNRPPASAPTEPITLPLPLAGGAGQPVVNAILTTINDNLDEISRYFSTREVNGRFWTV